jgi:hypothetical protein
MSAERPTVVIPPESAASGTELLPATAADPDRPGAAVAAEVVARVRAELPQMAGLGQREELPAAAWLMSLRSARTRRAYAGDLRAWLGWLAGRGTGVLAAGRVHVDLWVAGQQDRGAAAASVRRRLWPGRASGRTDPAHRGSRRRHRACVPLDQCPPGARLAVLPPGLHLRAGREPDAQPDSPAR